MLKTIAGVALAFALGAFCRWIDIPVPAPNRLIGAVLVVAVTLGYLAADGLLPPQGGAAPAAELAGDEKTRDDPKTAAGE
jgi:XapX domain-containing protein